MEIKQYEKDGSAEIIFTEQEKNIINERGHLKLTPEGLRHFGNNLVKIVADFQINFNQEVRNLETKEQDVETS